MKNSDPEKPPQRGEKRRRKLPSVIPAVIEFADESGQLIARPASRADDRRERTPKILIRYSGPARGGRHSGPILALGPQDHVLLRIKESADGAYPYYGHVICRLPRRPKERTTFLGLYQLSSSGEGCIVPADRRQRHIAKVLPAHNLGARHGDLVSAQLLSPTGRKAPQARVITRHQPNDFSAVGANDDDILLTATILEHDLPHEFPMEVAEEVGRLVPFSNEGRVDWRAIPFITIDPDDARDHDDAVWAAPDPDPGNPGGMVLRVAIADVGSYVAPGSAIDAHARLHGNSVYLPGRVIPMLPERISNTLCSLQAGEERAALCCTMVFDSQGQKRSHHFERAVIKVAARLTYEQAQAIADAGEGGVSDLFQQAIKPLWQAYHVLDKARKRRQPLEITVSEPRLTFGPGGEIIDIKAPARLQAHKLIETFMIAANVSAAQTLERAGLGFLRRIHEPPDRLKITELARMLRILNVKGVIGGQVKPVQFNQILSRSSGAGHDGLISRLIVQAQSQARYGPDSTGHYGLNLKSYTHFTSPIRRYADLLIHRALVSSLGLGPGHEEEKKRTANSLLALGDHLSFTERRAALAERTAMERFLARFLAGNLGKCFKGPIIKVIPAGLLVLLGDYGGIAGFCPASSLGPAYFDFDERQSALICAATGEMYQLGDQVEVSLVEAVAISGRIRLRMISAGKSAKTIRRNIRRKQRTKKHRHSKDR